MKPTIIILAIMSALLFAPWVSADEFKVMRSYSKLEDTSRVAEQANIKVDFSGLHTDERKVRKIGAKVIKRELEEGVYSEITYTLHSINKENKAWYLIYKWEYISDLESGKKPERGFALKIDLKNRTIVHNRAKDMQYGGPAPDIKMYEKYFGPRKK